MESTPLIILVIALIGFFGPTFAALIIARRQDKQNGIKTLLSGWKIRKVGIKWYLALFIINFCIVFIAIQLNIVILGNNPEINWGLWILFFTDYIRWMIIGGPIAEETGWRGYALPNMMKRHNALSSSLILGLIWGFWHLPTLLIPGAAAPIPFNLFLLLIYILNSMALSVIFTWIFNNTKKSIFISYLFHAAVNSIGNTLLSIYDYGTPEVAYISTIWFIILVQWVFVIILIIIYGKNLSRKK